MQIMDYLRNARFKWLFLIEEILKVDFPRRQPSRSGSNAASNDSTDGGAVEGVSLFVYLLGVFLHLACRITVSSMSRYLVIEQCKVWYEYVSPLRNYSTNSGRRIPQTVYIEHINTQVQISSIVKVAGFALGSSAASAAVAAC